MDIDKLQVHEPGGEMGERQKWFLEIRTRWFEVIENSGVTARDIAALKSPLETYPLKEARSAPKYETLNIIKDTWRAYLNEKNPDILKLNRQQQRRKFFGEKPDIVVSAEDETLLSLYQLLSEEVDIESSNN